MDKTFLDYQLSIDSLTVFSALKKDPVVHGLRDLFAALAKAVKARGLDITMFSGYTWEQLQERAGKEPALQELLDLTDILIDGPFIKAQ